MDAGREMDALIAEKVMGRTPDRLPPYSTDIAAAWLIIGCMWDRGWDGEVEWFRNLGGGIEFRCQFALIEKQEDCALAYRNTAPLAICRAALAALEVTA